MTKPLSPLTKSSSIEWVKDIRKNEIINDYKKNFNIDVSSYFLEIKKVSVYKCTETGYRFFYPFNLSGDSKFYEHFQKFNTYYMPWKWEHEISKQYIKDGVSLLEVGCAQGAYIKRINELFKLGDIVGLELNESVKGGNEKWSILNKTVQSFSESNKERFDVVCSYQVLEHISDVKSFLEAKIECLKKGGKLIISVPNNDSFIKHADNCLNMPPHHMGLWNEQSLRSLEALFPLKVLDVHFEDLQEYHVENYVSATFYSKYPLKLLRKIIRKINKILGIHQKLVKNTFVKRNKFIGQTILGVFEKL
ncbi:class I SAM-dependent methyltransferase [Yeosuana sp. AK3]